MLFCSRSSVNKLCATLYYTCLSMCPCISELSKLTRTARKKLVRRLAHCEQCSLISAIDDLIFINSEHDKEGIHSRLTSPHVLIFAMQVLFALDRLKRPQCTKAPYNVRSYLTCLQFVLVGNCLIERMVLRVCRLFHESNTNRVVRIIESYLLCN